MSSEVRVRDAVDRIMRAWSLIKLVPEQSGSGRRLSVTKLLLGHPHLTEDELVVIGVKHLYQTDGPKKQQERDVGVDDPSKDRRMIWPTSGYPRWAQSWSDIERYQSLLKTKLSDVEVQFLEKRPSEERLESLATAGCVHSKVVGRVTKTHQRHALPPQNRMPFAARLACAKFPASGG